MSVSRKQIKAERRQRRQMAAETRAAVEARQNRSRFFVLGGSVLALLLLIGLFAYFASRGPNTANLDPTRRSPDTTSQGFADQGNRHITQAEIGTTRYNSNPPTSGPHLPNLAPGGWHDEAVPKELVIHNLEDGYVAIQYRPDLDPGQKEQLRGLVNEIGDKVIAVPYEGLKTPIALTAWTRLDELPSFDKERIRNFVTAYRGIDHHKR